MASISWRTNSINALAWITSSGCVVLTAAAIASHRIALRWVDGVNRLNLSREQARATAHTLRCIGRCLHDDMQHLIKVHHADDGGRGASDAQVVVHVVETLRHAVADERDGDDLGQDAFVGRVGLGDRVVRVVQHERRIGPREVERQARGRRRRAAGGLGAGGVRANDLGLVERRHRGRERRSDAVEKHDASRVASRATGVRHRAARIAAARRALDARRHGRVVDRTEQRRLRALDRRPFERRVHCGSSRASQQQRQWLEASKIEGKEREAITHRIGGFTEWMGRWERASSVRQQAGGRVVGARGSLSVTTEVLGLLLIRHRWLASPGTQAITNLTTHISLTLTILWLDVWRDTASAQEPAWFRWPPDIRPMSLSSTSALLSFIIRPLPLLHTLRQPSLPPR